MDLFKSIIVQFEAKGIINTKLFETLIEITTK